MDKFAVIVPAAGQSRRFRANDRKKPFAELKGRAVWLHAVEHFVNRSDVVQTIVVIAPEDLDWFRQKFQANLAFLDVALVAGGATRCESVANALKSVGPDVDFVAVHDAARPLLVEAWIDTLFDAARRHGAVIPALPVTSTLKRDDGQRRIAETIDRQGLWAAQTPQVFRREWLLEAYAARPDDSATDDAELVEQLGQPVAMIDGWPMNVKITTRDDFRVAEALLAALPRKSIRALHPFAEDGLATL